MITNLIASIVVSLVTNSSSVVEHPQWYGANYAIPLPLQFTPIKTTIVTTTVDEVTTAEFQWGGKTVVAELNRVNKRKFYQRFITRTKEVQEPDGDIQEIVPMVFPTNLSLTNAARFIPFSTITNLSGKTP